MRVWKRKIAGKVKDKIVKEIMRSWQWNPHVHQMASNPNEPNAVVDLPQDEWTLCCLPEEVAVEEQAASRANHRWHSQMPAAAVAAVPEACSLLMLWDSPALGCTGSAAFHPAAADWAWTAIRPVWASVVPRADHKFPGKVQVVRAAPGRNRRCVPPPMGHVGFWKHNKLFHDKRRFRQMNSRVKWVSNGSSFWHNEQAMQGQSFTFDWEKELHRRASFFRDQKQHGAIGEHAEGCLKVDHRREVRIDQGNEADFDQEIEADLDQESEADFDQGGEKFLINNQEDEADFDQGEVFDQESKGTLDQRVKQILIREVELIMC
jgi:hypothetical protein